MKPWLFVIGGAQRGGAEGQFVRLASRLHAEGHRVECAFLFGGGPLVEELDRSGVPHHILRDLKDRHRALNVLSLAVAVFRLAVLLRRKNPAVVMAWLTFATWPTLLLAEFLTKAARVAGIRGEILRSEVRWAAPLFRRAVGRADAVVVNSNPLVDEAAFWGARRDRIMVIANGVDLPTEMSNPANSDAVVVANYRPYKGHADLVQALALCESDVKVRLCGSGGDQQRVERLAAELGVADRLHFVEQPADVQVELTRAGFAIHPSRTEGLSNAILEEMAAGLPVIAMTVGGNPMLVEPGVNGFLLEVGDHTALARALDALTWDGALRRRLGEGSREKIKQFTWEACVGHYADLLGRLGVPGRCGRLAAG